MPKLEVNANLYTALRAAFPENLDLIAVETDTGLHYSWRDLDRASAMMANLLESLSLPQGSRVAVQCDKSVEALVLYLATLRAGFVYLPLNTAYQQAELRYFIGDAEPAVVVCSPNNFPWVSTLSFQAGVRHVFTLSDGRDGSLLERAAHHADVHTPAALSSGDLAAILYTSGTTGRSKGAMLSHGNLLSNAIVLRDYWDWRTDDVLIHALPIFHVHGLFVAIHGALLNGTPMLWLSRFEPATVIERLPRATIFMGVPTLYVRLLQSAHLNATQCAHMRLFISGSAPLLLDTFQQFERRTGHTILERYGMSETLMLTSNPCRSQNGPRLGGTVGRSLPGIGVRVMDEHTPATTGTVGAIQVRGPSIFSGYWRMPEKTREEFTSDGWFITGDVGYLDVNGYLTIVGRSKDIIISGGYNVYPAEVESFINELPGIAESALIGVPHTDLGEAAIAIVIKSRDSDCTKTTSETAIIDILKTRIANYKVPKFVAFLDELPRNAMGKVQKSELRQTYSRHFSS